MGQQYFMEKAKEYGCDQFILFTGTPPVFMTKNGTGQTLKKIVMMILQISLLL